MLYPSLVPKHICKTNISVSVNQEGLGSYNTSLAPIKWVGLCNYQDTAKTILTIEKKVVEITGVALIPGDICPELAVISGGEAVVFGMRRRIERGTKARNPDGTVNYTKLELK